eukprot:TRINITY_DN14957_c0_g1_i1.p1 TRINITY_DN14957_c0_g1~~TRINITY_DN14957_c0_g1_i1.p1  ORF type:complete len:632 (+),score=108.73 TRINITY_DN14957_c0_g1_i1:46-1941(+)
MSIVNVPARLLERNRSENITKTHWVPDELRDGCTHVGCPVKFDLKQWRHHCRRCGEIFCAEHINFKLRLAEDAVPDPEGEFYAVCFNCFKDARRQEKGVLCERTFEYQRMRRATVGLRKALGERSSNALKLLARQPGDEKFEQEIVQWADASLVPACMECGSAFSWLKRKHHCRLCGAVFCADCAQYAISLKRSVLVPNGPVETQASVRACVACFQSILAKERKLRIQHDFKKAKSGFSDAMDRLAALKIKLTEDLPFIVNCVRAVEQHPDTCGAQLQRSKQLLASIWTQIKEFDKLMKFAVAEMEPIETIPARFKQNVQLGLGGFLRDLVYDLKPMEAKLRKHERAAIAFVYRTCMAMRTLCSEHNEVRMVEVLTKGLPLIRKDLQRAVLETNEDWKEFTKRADDAIARSVVENRSKLASSQTTNLPAFVEGAITKLLETFRGRVGDKGVPATQECIAELKRTVTLMCAQQMQAARRPSITDAPPRLTGRPTRQLYSRASADTDSSMETASHVSSEEADDGLPIIRELPPQQSVSQLQFQQQQFQQQQQQQQQRRRTASDVSGASDPAVPMTSAVTPSKAVPVPVTTTKDPSPTPSPSSAVATTVKQFGSRLRGAWSDVVSKVSSVVDGK